MEVRIILRRTLAGECREMDCGCEGSVFEVFLEISHACFFVIFLRQSIFWIVFLYLCGSSNDLFGKRDLLVPSKLSQETLHL